MKKTPLPGTLHLRAVLSSPVGGTLDFELETFVVNRTDRRERSRLFPANLGVGVLHGFSQRFRSDVQALVGGAAQHINLLLCRVQHTAAVMDEEVPALVLDEAFLEPKPAAFDLAEDLLKLARPSSNVLGGIWFFFAIAR